MEATPHTETKPRSSFVWYELMTSDLDGALAFYKDVVGWELKDSGMPGMRYFMFGKDGKDVGGISSMGPDTPTKWMGHLFTTDVDAATAAVVAAGGHVSRQPTDIPGVGRFSAVSDPQGAPYFLFQPNPTERQPAQLGPTDIGSVSWRELVTTDWEKAWEFYSTHYGWTKQTAIEMGPMGTYQTFMLDDLAGGGMMNLFPAADGTPPPPEWNFYFTVDAIHAAATRVTHAGGTVLQPPMQVPGGSWVMRGADPQGGRFALTAAH